jgi:hypothetical protein
MGAAMSVASAAITTAAPLVVSTPAHDDAWWVAEAVRTGTDWSGVVDAALEMLVAGGILEREPEPMFAWDAPSWRQAAVEYHRDRPGRLAVEIEPKRLARLRPLMADGVSLERAWQEIQKFSKGDLK